MGKFQQRLTITVHARMLGWRRLCPMNESSYEFSGQMVTNTKPLTTEYCSYIKFDAVKYYPTSSGRWDEHYLGIIDGRYIILYFKDQQVLK